MRTRDRQHGKRFGSKSQRPRPFRAPVVRAKPAVEQEHAADGRERLQKVLAQAGIASRRECEELIREGRVEVDRQVVTELGTRVDPQQQEIRVDGEALRDAEAGVLRRQQADRRRCDGARSGRPAARDRSAAAEHAARVLRRPARYVERRADPRHQRRRAGQRPHASAARRREDLSRAGRRRRSSDEVLAQLQRGIHLAEGFAHVKHVRIKSKQKRSTILEMVLDEGRNREVRRLLARVGHKVQRLKRIAVGPVRLGDLPTGRRAAAHEKGNPIAPIRGGRGQRTKDFRRTSSSVARQATKRGPKKNHKGHRGHKEERTVIGG